MQRLHAKLLLLALASAVPISLGAPSIQAAAAKDKGAAAAPADAAPGKAKGKSQRSADLEGNAVDVSAESAAEAGASTDDVEAHAAAEGAASISEDDGGASVSAETTADTSVATTSEGEVASKTRSFDKEITTKFGERSMSRSMTFVTLEDGTKVKTRSHAKAMALDTPGITKADTDSRADVRVQGEFGTDDAAVSGSDPDPADSTLDSPAISEANAGG